MRKDLPGFFLQRLHRYDTELIPGRVSCDACVIKAVLR